MSTEPQQEDTRLIEIIKDAVTPPSGGWASASVKISSERNKDGRRIYRVGGRKGDADLRKAIQNYADGQR